MEAVNGGGNNSPLEDEIKELVDSLARVEDDIKEQLQWLKSRGKKCHRRVDDWLKETRYLKIRAHEWMDSLAQGMLIDWEEEEEEAEEEDLAKELRDHIAERPLVLWKELVGEMFETNVESVLRLLRDDEVFIIGIHGMAGVGKTCLVTYIKHHITRNKSFHNFNHTFWVTVSQNFSNFKLQNDIARRIGLKLDEDDEIIRAEMLSSALEEKGNSLLILDDVWNHIDLSKVGIPLRVNGTKLILTSRLKHVCQQLDCHPDNIITMQPLLESEAWELFLLKLGYNETPATLDPNVEVIAKSVIKECGGLPLGISVMARTMKGVNNTVGQWRLALKKLQNSAVEEMGAEVFNVLKFSYDHLIDKNTQNCFLYCALYPPLFDYYHKEEFIMKWVDWGLKNEMGGLEEAFDEGLDIIDKLISHSLLLENQEGGKLEMHCLVRDMAFHIMEDKYYMMKYGKGLTKISHISKWTADLEVVSTVKNCIVEIPSDISPQCPKLSILNFSNNTFRSIPDCFFNHMNSLSVLDLSENTHLTCLPNSMSNLRSLISLVLRGCLLLKYVPPLGMMKKLSTLDISNTSIQNVPEGLEMLIKLKWLNLSRNKNLMMEPRSTLLRLLNMQYLDLRCDLGSANIHVKVKVEDVKGMRVLDYLACSIEDWENWNEYVIEILERGYGPKTYHLHLGSNPYGFRYCYWLNILDERIIYLGDCEDFVPRLPSNLTKLIIQANKQCTGCLCDAVKLYGRPPSLWNIDIEDCSKLESLFCLSNSCSLCTRLAYLDSLVIRNLESFNVILKQNDEGITQLSPPRGFFSHLKHLSIVRCHKMEKLFTAASLPNAQLPNLEHISVADCESMKEIFLTEDVDFTITLPKLKKLNLNDLPQLKVVCRGILASKSPPEIDCCNCPNLESSLQYKSLDSKDPSVILLKITICEDDYN
ncbi:hypothetical protein VNO77_11922 [Canavalia gladiata]|uniref:Disease resistance protein n=1 Tax=Canavalia gladiata TaxID=3824 RepID=A0AAN9M040_CANGL